MLAIKGGRPVRRPGTWQAWPPGHSAGAAAQLLDALESRRWTIRGQYNGRRSKQLDFAERFAKFNRAARCVLVSSGSTALLVALEACDVGAGDEVIIPVYTWIATAIAVTNVNAIPVFVDVDAETGCLDPQAVEDAITPRTRAIMPVHLHCAVADMRALTEIARRHEVFLIEDCAQAHGARLDGKFVGTIGHLGTFSMNQEKVLCCGEGGAILANDPALIDRAGRLRADGAREVTSAPVLGEYELVDTGGLMGGNYCMSDFQAAVLIAELDLLEERNRQRERNAAYLDERLAALGGVRPIRSAPGTTARTYFKYAIRRHPEAFEGVSTQLLCEALSAELGIKVGQTECQPLHQNVLYHPATKRRHHLSRDYLDRLDLSSQRFPIAEQHFEQTLTFSHSALLGTQREMEDVVEAFDKLRRYAGELVRDEVAR